METTVHTLDIMLLAVVLQIIFLVLALKTKGAFWWVAALACVVIWSLEVDSGLFYVLAIILGIAHIAGFIHSLGEETP
jgi:hypothetical protein